MTKKILLLNLLLAGIPFGAFAQDLQFQTSGLVGSYYGFAETKKENNTDNLPNRLVTRTDANANFIWQISPDYKLGLYNRFTFVLKQHDNSYKDGDWRYYPHIAGETPLGTFAAGYMYNAAHQLHKGVSELTIFGIEDSNITYFLSNPNWKNGKSSVAFATPKSTSIINDGRAMKFNYFTPQIGNTKFGFSYTPDNANRRGMVSRYADYEKKEDGFGAAMQNKWELNFADLYTSAGYGIFNRTDKEASLGLSLEKNGWSIGTGYKKAYIDGNKNPINTTSAPKQNPGLFDNYRESEAWNVSLQYKGEKYKTNLSCLQTRTENARNQDLLLVWANIYSPVPHWELYLIGAYLNAKGAQKDSDDNNKGFAVITGSGFRF